MGPIRRALTWAADYLYAGRRQLAALAPPWSVGRARPAPPTWDRGGADLPEAVLLPGVYEHWTFLRPLGDAIAAAGCRVRVVHGLGMNRRTVAGTAARLAQALATAPAPEAGRILVAHSKGGLIGKQLLLDAGRAPATQALGVLGLVAVCTPFGGSSMARLLPLDPSIRALRTDDATIVDLAGEVDVNASIVSVFGPYDPHIPEGSRLEGATNVAVPTAGHFRILGASTTHDAVIDGIRLLGA